MDDNNRTVKLDYMEVLVTAAYIENQVFLLIYILCIQYMVTEGNF